MKVEFEAKKREKTKPEVKKIQPESAKAVPKVEFLGTKIESHIDPRMNDPEYLKRQLELIRIQLHNF